MSSNNSNESTAQTNEIDMLLTSGKITNAVDFYNYFKNKQFLNQSSQASTSVPPASSTPPFQQQQKQRPNNRKKSKSNLNDYVNISCGPPQQQNQMKHNNSFNNGVPSHNKARHKKTFSSHNISNLASGNIINNMNTANPSLSLSSLSIDRQSPSPNSNQTKAHNKRTTLKSDRNIPQGSIFNAYQINELNMLESTNPSSSTTTPAVSNLGNPNQLIASDQQQHHIAVADTNFIEHLSSHASTTNTSPTPSSNDPINSTNYENKVQSISPLTTSYYQKYQQNQQQQPHQLKFNSSMFQQQQQHQQQPVYNSSFDRKKEDAINRIIRNEKIKQIRTKMYEYELLKEYGAVNSSLITQPLMSAEANLTPNSFISKQINGKKSKKKLNNKQGNSFISYQQIDNDDSLMNNIENDSDSDDKSSMSSVQHTSRVTKISDFNKNTSNFEQYTTNNVEELDNSKEETDNACNDLSFDDEEDEEFLFSDSNYESGIEEDRGEETKKGSSVKSGSTQRRQLAVKPGYERYDICSVNSFTISAFAQSTFQLKCSIISAEVKNIVNVLKQVIIYFILIF